MTVVNSKQYIFHIHDATVLVLLVSRHPYKGIKFNTDRQKRRWNSTPTIHAARQPKGVGCLVSATSEGSTHYRHTTLISLGIDWGSTHWRKSCNVETKIGSQNGPHLTIVDKQLGMVARYRIKVRSVMLVVAILTCICTFNQPLLLIRYLRCVPTCVYAIAGKALTGSTWIHSYSLVGYWNCCWIRVVIYRERVLDQ